MNVEKTPGVLLQTWQNKEQRFFCLSQIMNRMWFNQCEAKGTVKNQPSSDMNCANVIKSGRFSVLLKAKLFLDVQCLIPVTC